MAIQGGIERRIHKHSIYAINPVVLSKDPDRLLYSLPANSKFRLSNRHAFYDGNVGGKGLKARKFQVETSLVRIHVVSIFHSIVFMFQRVGRTLEECNLLPQILISDWYVQFCNLNRRACNANPTTVSAEIQLDST